MLDERRNKGNDKEKETGGKEENDKTKVKKEWEDKREKKNSH